MSVLSSHGLTQAIVKAFGDGTLHYVDQAIAECGYLIPPAIAVRAFVRRHGVTDRGKVSLELQVERGRRSLILNALRNSDQIRPGGEGRRAWSSFIVGSEPGGQQRGERHHAARLTEASAREILRRLQAGGVTQAALATEYRVSLSAISALGRGVTWKHLQAGG